MNKQIIIDKLNAVPVVLEPWDHVYHYGEEGDVGIFRSVSKVLASLLPPFDEEAMAIRCSQKPDHELYGLPPEIIIGIWREKNRVSCNHGTTFHHYAENKILGLPTLSTTPISFANAFDEFFEKILSQIELVILEKALCHPDYRVAGTPDYLGIIKNMLIILDWKTNGKFDTVSDYKLLPPFSSFDKSKLTIYTFQTYIYKFFLEEFYKIPVKDSRIVWFYDPKETKYTPSPYATEKGNGWVMYKPKFPYDKALIEKLISR